MLWALSSCRLEAVFPPQASEPESRECPPLCSPETHSNTYSRTFLNGQNMTIDPLIIIKQPCMATVSKLSNEMTSRCQIMKSHYDAEFVTRKEHYFIKRTA